MTEHKKITGKVTVEIEMPVGYSSNCGWDVSDAELCKQQEEFAREYVDKHIIPTILSGSAKIKNVTSEIETSDQPILLRKK